MYCHFVPQLVSNFVNKIVHFKVARQQMDLYVFFRFW